MKKVLVAMLLWALAIPVRAQLTGCQNTTGPTVLQKVRSTASGTQIYGCINSSFDTLSASATYVGGTPYFPNIWLKQISGYSGGIYVSSPTTFGSSVTVNAALGVTGGINSSTITVGTSDVVRDDALINVTGAQKGFSINDNSASATNTEAWMTFMAKDSAAAWRKRMSISSLWVDNTAGSGFANLRFNATINGGQNDDVFFVGYGGNGAAFFPPDSVTYPGASTLRIHGKTDSATAVVRSTLTVGVAAAQTGYALYAAGGGSPLGGTDMVSHALLDGSTAKGSLFGFDSTANLGTLTCASASCGTAFWSHNGDGWAERMRVHTNGKIGMYTTNPLAGVDIATHTAITGGARLIVGDTDTWRSDAKLEITGVNGGGFSINDSSAPYSTNSEAFMTMYGYDSAGAKKKRTSISSKWADATAGSGFAYLRLNATHNAGDLDDVFLAGYGQHGATFFPLDSAIDYPGDKILWVRGQTKTDTGVVTSTLTIGSAAQTTYTLSARGGGSLLGTTNMVSHALLDGGGTKGILAGYDSAEAVGTLSCASASCGTAFWSHNGTAGWAERMRVHTNGFIGIADATPEVALDVSGSIRSTGPVTAERFIGGGAELTSLTPGNMASGAFSEGVSIPASGVDLSTVTTAFALKAPLTSPNFMGTATFSGSTMTVASTGIISAPSQPGARVQIQTTMNLAAGVETRAFFKANAYNGYNTQGTIDLTNSSGTFTARGAGVYLFCSSARFIGDVLEKNVSLYTNSGRVAMADATAANGYGVIGVCTTLYMADGATAWVMLNSVAADSVYDEPVSSAIFQKIW